MIPNNFFSLWYALAPKLADHLWQSTLFAVVLGLLTLVLRQNHPRFRYWLWLAASVKFLLPFSLLVSLGSRFGWPGPTPATHFYSAMEQASQPFSQATTAVISRIPTPRVVSSSIEWVPITIATIWLCGFAFVLVMWYVRWQRLSAAVRQATQLHAGREMESLRRLQRIAVASRSVRILRSRASLEPGVFGIFRSVLLWPEGITEHLSDAHLDAILAHELRHVQRRDNLTAVIHMAVEAVFWFHPLVWWLGVQMVTERERACDEDVVQLGNQRQVYAESILKVCEFCLESPLACVAGVTGSDLKKRMVNIMTGRILRKLNFSKKLLLSATAAIALAAPIFIGMVNPAISQAQSPTENATANAPAFQSVSIKPSNNGATPAMTRFFYTPAGFGAQNVTVQMLIRDVYGVRDSQISGAPGWLNVDRYDIEATLPQSMAAEVRSENPSRMLPERQQMLRTLLQDRFKLAVHHQVKDLPVYILVIADGGPKLHEAKAGDSYAKGINTPDGRLSGPGNMMVDRGMLRGQALTISDLTHMLSDQVGRPVLDKTGLTGQYDFSMQWTPAENELPEFKQMGAANAEPQPVTDGASLFSAIQEQLGLKLEPQTSAVDTVVIDHVEKPSEN